MKNMLKMDLTKRLAASPLRRATAPEAEPRECTFVPICVTGYVIPKTEPGLMGWRKGFKLASTSGVHYSIEADSEGRSQLARYRWEAVRVVGLLNRASMTILLQKLFPFGPNDSGVSMADVALRIVRKVASDVFGGPGGIAAACAALP